MPLRRVTRELDVLKNGGNPIDAEIADKALYAGSHISVARKYSSDFGQHIASQRELRQHIAGQ